MTFSPASCRREAPIGGYLSKKLLDLFREKMNILRKKGKFNFKIIVIGQGSVFILQSPNMRNSISEKRIIITIWPSSDDNDHGLILTIDMDSQRTKDEADLCF
jgi:hypothetical protein